MSSGGSSKNAGGRSSRVSSAETGGYGPTSALHGGMHPEPTSGRTRSRATAINEGVLPEDTAASTSRRKKPRNTRGLAAALEADGSGAPFEGGHDGADALGGAGAGHGEDTEFEGYDTDGDAGDTPRIADLLQRLREAPSTGNSRYTGEQIDIILELFGELKQKMSVVNKVTRIPGFEKVSTKHIRYWLKPKDRRQVGRPVDSAFEAQVLQQLLMDGSIAMEGEHYTFGPETNLNYDSVRNAGRIVQSQPEWQGIKRVVSLQMSNRWVWGFLKRHGLQRFRDDLGAEADLYPGEMDDVDEEEHV